MSVDRGPRGVISHKRLFPEPSHVALKLGEKRDVALRAVFHYARDFAGDHVPQRDAVLRTHAVKRHRRRNRHDRNPDIRAHERLNEDEIRPEDMVGRGREADARDAERAYLCDHPLRFFEGVCRKFAYRDAIKARHPELSEAFTGKRFFHLLRFRVDARHQKMPRPRRWLLPEVDRVSDPCDFALPGVHENRVDVVRGFSRQGEDADCERHETGLFVPADCSLYISLHGILLLDRAYLAMMCSDQSRLLFSRLYRLCQYFHICATISLYVER